MFNALAATLKTILFPTSNIHRLGRGLTRVSNPVCYPRFRASVSEMTQELAFAFGVPPNIHGFHPYIRVFLFPLSFSSLPV